MELSSARAYRDLPATDWQPAGGLVMMRLGRHLRGLFDRLIASSSLVPNCPVLNVRDFPWTAELRDKWQNIQKEAIDASASDHRSVVGVANWRSASLWGSGNPIADNLVRCPETAKVLQRIPGLTSAFFSILAPGTHIPEHRGATKGLITCHLGLIVPRDGDVRMRVKDRIVRWAEGETLIFDDTYRHEVWNDTKGTRVVLLVQFERPLRNPGKWFAGVFMGLVRRSFVEEARGNVAHWNAAVRQLEM